MVHCCWWRMTFVVNRPAIVVCGLFITLWIITDCEHYTLWPSGTSSSSVENSFIVCLSSPCVCTRHEYFIFLVASTIRPSSCCVCVWAPFRIAAFDGVCVCVCVVCLQFVRLLPLPSGWILWFVDVNCTDESHPFLFSPDTWMLRVKHRWRHAWITSTSDTDPSTLSVRCYR